MIIVYFYNWRDRKSLGYTLRIKSEDDHEGNADWLLSSLSWSDVFYGGLRQRTAKVFDDVSFGIQIERFVESEIMNSTAQTN